MVQQVSNKSTDVACILPGIQQVVGSANLMTGLYDLFVSILNYKKANDFCQKDTSEFSQQKRLLEVKIAEAKDEYTYKDKGLCALNKQPILRTLNKERFIKAREAAQRAFAALEAEGEKLIDERKIYEEKVIRPKKSNAKKDLDQAMTKIMQGALRLLPIMGTIYSIYALMTKEEELKS